MSETAHSAPATPSVHPGLGASTVERLGGWAASLADSSIQPGLRDRALLQHLSAAASVRQLRAWADLDMVPEEVPGARAGRVDALELGDRLLGAEGVVAGVVAAWDSGGPTATVSDLVRATVAANEIAGRVGLSAALAGQSAQNRGRTGCVAAAVASAVLLGLDGAGVSRALALALALAPQADPRRLGGHAIARVRVLMEACRLGLHAAELASEGASAPLDLLDRDDERPWPLLSAAFTGLGQAWLGRTLSFGLEPVAPVLAVPVQAVHEILRRHVKAADKRLRVDQVEGIEVHAPRAVVDLVARVGAPSGALRPAALPWQLAQLIGARIATHESSVASLSSELLQSRAAQVQEIAAKVHVRHDPVRSATVLAHRLEVLAPLMAGLDRRLLRRMVGGLREDDGSLPFRGALQLVRLRPERLLARIRRSPADLAAVPMEAWRDRVDTEVILHTTRGGHWPERRELAEGSPGWPWADTVARVRARFSADDADLAARAEGLLAIDGQAPAADFCTALLR